LKPVFQENVNRSLTGNPKQYKRVNLPRGT